MTNYSLIKNELMNIMHCDAKELEQYALCIENAAAQTAVLLKEEQNENDPRIVRLCAVKAYYQIILTDDFDGGITSFKAGDVSYTKDTSSAERAERLLKFAVQACGDMIKNSNFSFRAV